MIRSRELASNAVLRLRRLAQTWRRSRSASVLPLVAMSGLALTGVTGLALDGARIAIMSSRLQASLDAGGISAGARVSTAEFEAEVERFANANFHAGYVGARITSLTTTRSADEDTFTVFATAEAPTIFMKIFGIDSFETSAQTEVTRAMGGLELSLVLDVTGSMNEHSKLDSLKVAANDLLEILFGESATADKLYVGIVPFSQAVNIGKSRTNWLTRTPAIREGWAGCVEARFDGRDVTDAAPTVQKFRPAVGMTYCPSALTPLTSSKETLSKAVRDLRAEGGTFTNVGAVWGWRMLSPDWKEAWSGAARSLPFDYGERGMSKAVVIMTDGENQYNTGGAYGGMNCRNLGWQYYHDCSTDARLNVTDRYEGYSWYDSFPERRDVVVGPRAHASLDAKFSEICTSMKNAGIVVYTVAFGNLGETTEERLRNCATLPIFFFNTPTGAELRTAFAKIGDSLSSLRISR